MDRNQKQQRKKSPEQMVEAIFALDLDPIKVKLMDKKEGQGWSRAKADAVELEYRRFLALTVKYPDAAITPNTDVDKFWHSHILDTMKYAQDCQEALGYFLHHFPYFGMRDEEDAVKLSIAATYTKALYEKEFGAVADKGGPKPYCCVVSDVYCGATMVSQQADADNGGPKPYCCVVSNAYCDVTTASKQAKSAYFGAADAGDGDVILCKGRPKLQAESVV